MSEKRFTWDGDILFDNLELKELGNCLEARDIADLLNELYEQREYYRRYALLYITDFDLYSDDFIESMGSIYGSEFASKLLKDRDEIVKALKKEGLYNE